MPLPDLAGTRGVAMRSLAHTERRFLKDENFREAYRSFMDEYEELGHMSAAQPISGESSTRTCYLPHLEVWRESSTTTKLRVVFNGSLLTAAGHSLNQNLLVGANLLPALADILLRWRRHRFVLTSDVEKMFRQILVYEEDRDLQRIVWRGGDDGGVVDYRLNTVTYGLACAPFLAIRSLRQLAVDEGSKFPKGADALLDDVYMDDVLTGADTLGEVLQIRNELIQLCRAGGFPLKKWTSNEEDLLADIPREDRLLGDPRSWQSHHAHSTLGLQWHPRTDQFAFLVLESEEQPVTKRSILSETARLFDPLGWLTPVIIRAKILVQTAWLMSLDWDAPMPEAEARQWGRFREELPLLNQVRVPRWLTRGSTQGLVELHGFADASERAYAAVVYLRALEDSGTTVKLSLVGAKTKVAPLKQVSLPRLELCAAALLARLIQHFQVVLGLQDSAEHLWTDSTVALSWIQGHPTRWKTYVANRVAEIQRTVPEAQWHHLSSASNPADCASRGVSPGDLVEHGLWWGGPPWLSSDAGPWPSASELPAVPDAPEQRARAWTVAANYEERDLFPLQFFSSLNRLLQVSAWCRRWLCRRNGLVAQAAEEGESGCERRLTVHELESAEIAWIRVVQAENYKMELAAVLRSERLKRSSLLTSLNPFVDESGILRVGGRLKRAPLPFEQKHPAILPRHSHFMILMVDACHQRTLHGGVQQTLSLLRQRFWVPQGRSLVKKCIHRCVKCARWRAATPQQLMSDLPPQRVSPSRSFLYAGVDYAGPYMLRTAPGRGHKARKRFLVIFVCLATKAVHLDVASDYTAEAFLAAFRRFTSRRGLCRELSSDCGTNFVGADSQLRKMFAASSREARVIAEELTIQRVRWRFNPPAAPHFGGIWKAAVTACKHHLRRVVGEATLTYEEMATLHAQIEACLNSRPLTPLTDDPDDVSALTPGHFLVGSALTAIPEPSQPNLALSCRSRWQLVQRMRDHFWERWAQEYIHCLVPRPKWRNGTRTSR